MHRQLAAQVGPAPTVLATVVSVDQQHQTVELQDDNGQLIHAVRLRPVIDGKTSMVLFPKVGTWVLAVRIEGESEWMAIAQGEADKYQLTTGNTKMTIDNDGFIFQKGTQTMWDGLKLILEALEPVVIMQGTNINFIKLAAGKALLKGLLNGS